MIRLLEKYGDGEITVEGRTYPANCLVEDFEGNRIIIVDDLAEVPAGDYGPWVHGRSRGARIITSLIENGHWASAAVETFMEFAVEHRSNQTLELPEAHWTVTPEFPTYADVVATEPIKLTGGFVHLHNHSEFSALDGLSRIDEMVQAALDDEQPAVAITDHGVCAGHPVLYHAAQRRGIKPIFGIEANLVDDRFNAEKENLYNYWHLIMWAQDDDGLRNLWAMSTEANRDGFYGRPRMDWETLRRYSEGVMVSTACLRGPVAKAIEDEDEGEAKRRLGRLLDIFGNRTYVELQTNALPEQRKLNEAMVGLANDYSLPMILASDAHYASIEDRETHKVWIAAQTNKELTDDADLFAGDSDYHMMTEAEVRKAVSYLPDSVVDEAVANTLMVAERVNAKVEGDTTPPIYSKADTPAEAIESDVDRLLKVCFANWNRCVGRKIPEEAYIERFEREMKLLIDKGFCGYFLMVSDYCRWSREHGILVGPGRGSGSGSLVAYLSDITGIDPLEADLMFERFLTQGRKALPDFDVDFPASKRQELTDYIIDRYGVENVVRVGTHIRLKNKGVIRDLARVMKKSIDIHYPDIEAVAKIIDEAEADKAGQGMDWEDLWDEQGEVLQPYRDKYSELFDYADRLVGRLKTYGKHAAGLVIAPDADLAQKLPLRRPGRKDPDLVAEFDMSDLEELGLVKFDILTLRTLDTIQMCVDLIRSQRGIDIDIYSWREEYEDPEVWEEISDGHTLGIFQIETAAGTRACRRFRPQSLDDLSDVITLIRPGPVRSGLTETYFKRRVGEEQVSFVDPRLEAILSKTYGAMIYQEQVMQTCMVLAGYDETEADVVRKILGKKQTEKVEEAGRKFTSEAVKHDTDPEVARVLWEQMAEFAKYSFNRSHAYGYAMLGFWTAWLKVRYPVQFLTAILSTVDKGRIPEFITEARRMGYKVLPPDINASGEGFSSNGKEIRYGFDGVKGVGAAAVKALMEGQPYTSFEDFMERKGPKANMGVIKLMAQLGAFDSIEPNRKALVDRLEWESTGQATKCVYKDDWHKSHINELPCHFDWDNEPQPISEKTGRKLKLKPPPKRCTIRCRNYTPPEEPEFTGEFTPRQIMDIEMELLGVHLTHTPFDAVPEEYWDEEATREALGLPIQKGDALVDGPNRDYLAIATVRSIRPYTAKNGKKMGFVGFYALNADLDVTVFSSNWEKFRRDLVVGDLYLIHVHKNERGFSLLHLNSMSPEGEI